MFFIEFLIYAGEKEEIIDYKKKRVRIFVLGRFKDECKYREGIRYGWKKGVEE